MCQNLRHPETQPESLLPLANHRMMVIPLLLTRSNKTVFSGERADIYVGERLRLAAVEGVGNNLSGARSFSGRRSDDVSLARHLWRLINKYNNTSSSRQ